MSNNDLLTDDYVADLLAKDAKDCSLKYSAMGMEAFNSTAKKPTNMPKPNTRFLRHIIKNTDSHNNKLLAKEAAESRARLESLEHAEETKRLKTNPNTRDIRRRQMGDIHAILGGKRRRERKDDEGKDSSSRRHDESERRSSGKDRDRDGDLFSRASSSRKHHGRLADDDYEEERRHRRRRDDDDDGHSRRRHRRESRRHDDEPRSSRRRHASESDNEDSKSRRRRDRHRSRSRSRSPTSRHDTRRRRSPHESSSRRHRHRHRSPDAPAVKETQRPREPEEHNSDSDDLMGPMPAPKPRGRGALAGSSGIDRRFSETYDPKTDIQMDNDDEDNQPTAPPGSSKNWEDTVEAFRDQQKLKQNRAQRLREAGFTDEDMQRAGAVAAEPSAEDLELVTWSKAGEKREWDKDKEEES